MEGKCVYCNETLAKKDIGKHLKKHLTQLQKKSPSIDKAYHLTVESGEYFLELLIDGAATFESLDLFFRDIWVECCDHLSGFHSKVGEIEMPDTFQEVLTPKMKFTYAYDYGTTTELSLKVAGIYQLSTKEDVVLLSRNEPFKWMCSKCKKKPAVFTCTAHDYNFFEYMYCESCANKHKKVCEDFEDYGSKPVVNSPRMGECNYEGGSIDLERDGVYKI